ncbi:MAG: ParB/RepB/Spo0J family partition protein [Firmicutes bacterium]|nr:ParB/RepB/Spo0J family partition protein [Bacillota bacterium]
MVKKSGGLGRGLGSLFGDMDVDLSVLDPAEISVEPAAPVKTAPAKKAAKGRAKAEKGEDKGSAETVEFVSLDDIRPNSSQPRKVFDQEALQDLASSIREHGVIQPVLLRPAKNGFELVAGERRWRAARLAGLKQIPAIVRDLTDRQNMFYALIENMQREDLNSIEEARGMEEMMSAFGLNQEETAKTIGKSRSYVTNALRLLRLPQDVQDMVMDGRLSAGHARAIAGLEGEALQSEAAAKCVENGWSVRQVESYTGEQKKPAKRRRSRLSGKNKDKELAAVEQQITEALGTKVRIRGTEKKGRLELDYYSRGELERLIEILSSAQ